MVGVRSCAVSGEVLGRRLLRLDAAYCGAAGVIAVAAFGPLSDLFGVPAPLLFVAGPVTIVWAGLLYLLAARPAWRPPVFVVAAANTTAAVGLAALAFVSPGTAARVLLAAVALEVAAFAVGQLVALRR